jgi:hypothetical protein
MRRVSGSIDENERVCGGGGLFFWRASAESNDIDRQSAFVTLMCPRSTYGACVELKVRL